MLCSHPFDTAPADQVQLAVRSTETHCFEIFTPGFRWYGDLAVPAQSLADFFNDATSDFLTLQHVTLSKWENQQPRELATFESAVVNKRMIMAAILRIASPVKKLPNAPGTSAPHRVLLYVPPLALAGNLAVACAGDWTQTLNALAVDFVTLTEVTTFGVESSIPLSTGHGLAFVQRRWITAIEPLLNGSASLGRVFDLYQRIRTDWGQQIHAQIPASAR